MPTVITSFLFSGRTQDPFSEGTGHGFFLMSGKRWGRKLGVEGGRTKLGP